MTAQEIEQYEWLKQLAASINMTLMTGSLIKQRHGIILWENHPVENLHRVFMTIEEVQKFLEGYLFYEERWNRLVEAGITL